MSKEQIEKEFKAGEMSYIDAVLRLQMIDYPSLEAEEMVQKWETEIK